MRETDSVQKDAEAVAEFNECHAVGTLCRFFSGGREGPGEFGRTTHPAELFGGHTAVVWLDMASSCIALSHVDVITEPEETAMYDLERAKRFRRHFANLCEETREAHDGHTREEGKRITESALKRFAVNTGVEYKPPAPLVACPGCSEAGGAGRTVYHEAPACLTDLEANSGD